MPLRKHARALEAIYGAYNRRGYVHPDPLEFLYRYEDPADREVVGLIAALLAYGRVAQILRSVGSVLDRLGPGPAGTLRSATEAELSGELRGFRHRFQTDRQLVALLLGVQSLLRRRGSLRACFVRGLRDGHQTVLPAMRAFVAELGEAAGGQCGHLLPDPSKASACKRLHLFLRWMVRRDDVDPGGWDDVPPAKLMVPLDTHMHRVGLALGATRKRTAGLAAAIELTEAFRRVQPADPVKYDFAITRLGIRRDADLGGFLAACRSQGAADA